MRRVRTLIALLLLAVPAAASAATFSDTVRGRILLQVQQHGEAWYVNPADGKRYYMKDGATAYEMMRKFGLGISNADFAKLSAGNASLKAQLKGRIVLEVERHGEATYILPTDGSRHYLKDGDAAYQIMRLLSLGITDADLAKIPASEFVPIGQPAPPADETYQTFTMTIPRGSFALKVVTLDRAAFEMVTDTAEPFDCASDCDAKALADYILENGAVAGIHGSYFCPPDYADCASKVNTFLPPVYNTELSSLVNADGVKFFNRPMIASGKDGRLFYYHRAPSFGGVAAFEQANGTELQAAIGNWPSLVENGTVLVESEPLESGFLTKGTRGGIGWNDQKVFLVIASSASVTDLAYVMKELGVNFAMNLDGGGSVALYESGQYRAGPGRELPTAILFKKK